MTSDAFNDVVEKQYKLCTDILCKKSDEYVDKVNDDRLHNFKCAGGYRNRDPKDALWGMATKHFVSISDMCQDGNYHSIEMWNEKITDAINYLFLLKGLVVEEHQEKMERETVLKWQKVAMENASQNDSIRREAR